MGAIRRFVDAALRPGGHGGGVLWSAVVAFLFASILYGWQTLARAAGAFFYADDYTFIQSTASWAELVFAPYNGHIGYTAGLFWVTLLEVAGAGSYVPFLALAVIFVIVSAAAVFALASRLLGPFVALTAGLWTLFLGPAFHNQLWDQASLALIVLPVLVALSVIGSRAGRGWQLLALAVVVVGAGTGGLAAGVLASFIALSLVLRRWIMAAGVAVVLVVFAVLGSSSLPEDTNLGASPLILFSRVPSYVLAALQGTVQAGLNIPPGMAGAVALVVVLGLVWALVLAVRDPQSLAATALIVCAAYLLFTWAAAGYVRGIVDEVAAPRYLGVTGPVLLLAILAASRVLLAAWGTSHNRDANHARRGERIIAASASIILAIAALSNLPTWRDARENATYLGAGNVAALSALHAGRSWIAPGFTPPGEGLTTVRQAAIEDAWQRRGAPDLMPAAILARDYPQQSAGRLVETALAAGWVTQQPIIAGRYSRPAGCAPELVLDARRATAVRVFGDGPVTASALGALPQAVPYSGTDGRILVRPLRGAGEVLLRREGGCLAPLGG
jgi:hypothetical protein